MLVSVIVPTYNRASMITKTIQSILNQTYKDIEIIVVDDGSTDNTDDVIVELSKDSIVPIRYFKKPNGGCSSARNMGVRKAAGEYIAFLDSDDQFTPQAIESLVTALISSGADFVYSPSIEINILGKEMLALPAAPGRPEEFAREHYLTLRARPCCNIYNKSIFEKFMFEESARYNEDSDFLQKVAINYKAAYSAVPSAMVFQHGTNKSSNSKEIYRALVKSYESTLKSFPEFAESLGELANRRLDQIKTEFIEVLARLGEFEEAAKIAASMDRKGALVSLSIAIHSGVPFTLIRNCRTIVRITGKLFKKMVK